MVCNLTTHWKIKNRSLLTSGYSLGHSWCKYASVVVTYKTTFWLQSCCKVSLKTVASECFIPVMIVWWWETLASWYIDAPPLHVPPLHLYTYPPPPLPLPSPLWWELGPPDAGEDRMAVTGKDNTGVAETVGIWGQFLVDRFTGYKMVMAANY